MKILITGSTGLLGQALVHRLTRSHEVVGLSRHQPIDRRGIPHVPCDLIDADATRTAIATVRPDVVIHTQALSNVDQCELQPNEAYVQNVTATTNLLQAVEPLGTLVVHLSTDYVFDGLKGSPYDERDRPNPLSVYARSKLEAEQRVLACARSVVVRPSTLFGPGRRQFCDHLVERMTAGEPVEAFSDQVTSPTYTVDLADGIAALSMALLALNRSALTGLRVYHVANGGGCSRVEFAQRVAQILGVPASLIRQISMDSQHRPAPRPHYSALTSVHSATVIGRTLRPWDDALLAYLRH